LKPGDEDPFRLAAKSENRATDCSEEYIERQEPIGVSDYFAGFLLA
jgi:hypothetical protein